MSASSQIAPLASDSIPDPLAVPAWKREVNARLNAHRSRHGSSAAGQPELPGMESTAPDSRAARVAQRVAQRYAQAPSFREALAAEAARAVEAARAAEAAAEAARAAHEAAMAVTDALRADATVESGFEFGAESEENASGPSTGFARTSEPSGAESSFFVTGREPRSAAPQYEAVQYRPEQYRPDQYRVDPSSLPAPRRDRYTASGRRSGDLWPMGPDAMAGPAEVDPHPGVADPFEDALVAPAEPLPARVLEFPRELIATRKARPRLAEGPLHDPAGDPGQLRIFEVETESIDHQPEAASAVGQAAVDQTAAPAWTALRLDAEPPADRVAGTAVDTAATAPFSSRARHSSSRTGYPSHSLLADMLPLHVAPFEDRLMAAVVDTALVGCALLLFVLVFVACTPHPPMGKPAMVAAAAALFALTAIYQALFFTWGEATPGMRYAKIALCTFDDENPHRTALQKRVGALLLSALPLGLGFLWALFDDDRLSWHDRMTRTYQRSYK